MSTHHRSLAALLALVLAGAGCASEDAAELYPDEEFSIDGPFETTPPPGKDDGPYRKGLAVATNTTATQVWSAKNAWEDRDTPNARKAGVAWAENSGLNWDEKYSAWINGLRRVRGAAGYYDTFEMTTPWGKTVIAPSLECAEVAIFMRATFAAWYQLPFFMEAVDARGVRVYFGHNGIRTAAGKYGATPNFATAYADTSATPPADIVNGWPKDAKLRSKGLAGGEDVQPFPAGTRFGAFADEIHLNKRAGHFLILLLDYFGSMNLADSANTYNLVPDRVRAGDVLLERWQRVGIGHTLLVKTVGRSADGRITAELASGSMPRRQPKWEDETVSKGSFENPYTGGMGAADDGTPYAKLGGGLKRWRVTKNIAGVWTNTWMAADESAWINDTDTARISARPETFGRILGEVSPAEKRMAYLGQIADARLHLSRYPASCSARERREDAFDRLYELERQQSGRSRAAVDTLYRTHEDYVFAKLEYTKSKTCCWNSSTADMYRIIMDRAEKLQMDAQACVAPEVFMNDGGYGKWKSFATATGRAAQWKEWAEDEPCAQRDVAADTAVPAGTPWCSVSGGGGGGGATCTDDAQEQNDSRETAKLLARGSYPSLVICGGDDDFLAVTVPAGGALTAKITFSNAVGDLDLELFAPGGEKLGSSAGTGDSETVTKTGLPAGTYVVRVTGYDGAVGGYALTLQ